MRPKPVPLPAEVASDGTLRCSKKPGLPPGPVSISLRGTKRTVVAGYVDREGLLRCDQKLDLCPGEVQMVVRQSPGRDWRDLLGTVGAYALWLLAVVLAGLASASGTPHVGWGHLVAPLTSLAGMVGLGATFAVWYRTRRTPPVEYDRAAQELAASQGPDGGVLQQHLTWLFGRWVNESQLIWQRFSFFLAIEGVLVGALATVLATAGDGVKLVVAFGALGVSVVWLHFTRVGACQIAYWSRQAEFHHEAYLRENSGADTPLLHWARLNGALRRPTSVDGAPGLQKWFDDCRFPWPGNHPKGGMSRIAELMAWAGMVLWSLWGVASLVRWVILDP